MRAHLRTLAILLGTVGLLALFLRQVSLGDVWQQMTRASPLDLLLALAMTGLTYVLRAWRWNVLLEPLGRPHFSTTFRATVIGFAANGLLPARAGEVLRPLLLARREGLSATAVFATVLLERLLDLVCVLLLFGWFVWFSGAMSAEADPALFRTVQAGGVLAGLASVGCLLVVFVAAGHPERLGRFARKAERFLPSRIAHALAHLIERFAEGFAVVRRPAPLVAALLLSLPLWLSIATSIWLVARAFHLGMTFTSTYLIIALLTVGVALPTPGAVGGFHYAFRLGATAFFDVPTEPAVGAAIVLHAVSFLPVTLLGVVFMIQDGLGFSRLRHWAAEAAEPEALDPAAARAAPAEPALRPGADEKRAKA